jgi:hypothetical protein
VCYFCSAKKTAQQKIKSFLCTLTIVFLRARWIIMLQWFQNKKLNNQSDCTPDEILIVLKLSRDHKMLNPQMGQNNNQLAKILLSKYCFPSFFNFYY